MNKLEMDNLVWTLKKRMTLVETLQATLQGTGDLYRQITLLDSKLRTWLAESSSVCPEDFTLDTFKALVQMELRHQVEHGDPPLGSALAAMAALQPERQSLVVYTKDLHDQLIADNQPQPAAKRRFAP